MVDDVALRCNSTGPRAGVRAPLIATGLVLRTVCADYALGSAGGWASQVPSDAGTDRLTVHHATLAIGSAGCRATGVSGRDI